METEEPGSEILNVTDYPPSIRGSLRVILQLKDAFITCFNLVEEYRSQLLACQRAFAREMVVYKLTEGLGGIIRLREDLQTIENKAHVRADRNGALRSYLVQRYGMGADVDSPTGPTGLLSRLGQDDRDPNGGTGTAVLSGGIPPPICAPDSVEAALHGGLDQYSQEINVDIIQVPEEINLATCTTSAGSHLLPVVEFYRGFFFLQMHFQLIMCQAANYAMPVVTRSMGLAERAFAWPVMPTFGLSAASGTMRDRLLEIHSEVTQLAVRLYGCLVRVRDKLQQDRRIESYYFQHMAAQEALRRNLLRCLQSQRVYLDCLETQNDRLAGLAIKMDPKFSRTTEFTLMTGTNMNNLKDKGWNQSGNPMGFIDSSDNDSDDYPTRDDAAETGKRSKTQEGHKKQDSWNKKASGNEQFSGSEGSGEVYRGGFPIKVNTNVSASGFHQTAAVVQQGGYRKQLPTDVVIPETKVKSLHGDSAVINELLIGFDPVASNGPKLEDMGAPPMLNSAVRGGAHFDEPVKETRVGYPPARPAERRLMQPRELQSPSLRGSQTDSFPSTVSIPPRQPKTVTNMSASFSRLPDQNASGELSQTNGEVSEYTDNTLNDFTPRGEKPGDIHLDTNVNASDVRFPKLVNPPVCQPLPQKRTQRSSSATHLQRATAMNPPVPSGTTCGERIGDYTRRLPPPSASSVKPKLALNHVGIFPTFEDVQHENQMLRLAVEGHVQPVTSVGSAECSPFCAPDWTGRSAQGAKKPDDLLKEPKRSAVNKALVSHRSRLVETILQADGEKLDELISLLMRE